ncbi:polysaccharide biosynthesis protein [Clostridium aceticum]|uniref:Polysaccharide biosynthesis protein n=1 Tax=Clostridium aceticum TaxID=84022 RepID=A0A0D8IB29_9CLOT|nr:polysaccharide biosynthesis C-terminal domain-containing protein [Clostridium aceticum]AKL93662.1 polysaccharide biosynthesis protein [Clostridium aceticum]KJF27237.1 hypothetical protein TZ02_09250 [Clostridium aceticum]
MLKVKKKNMLIKILPIIAYLLGPMLNLLILPIVTHSINPDEYGIYNYYISIINYILIFTFFTSINSGVLRFLNTKFVDYKKDKVALVKIIGISTILYFIVSGLVFLIYKDPLFLFLIIGYYFINLTTFYKSFLNINGNKLNFSLLIISITILQYVVVLIMYYYRVVNVYHLLLGNFVLSVIFISRIIYLKRNMLNVLKAKTEDDTYKKLFRFMIPTIGIALAGIILSSGDRIIIKNLLEQGDFYVGIYSVNYVIYAQVMDILTALFFLYIPYFLYTKYESKGIEDYLKGLNLFFDSYLLIGTLIFTLVSINYDKINFILFDEKYLVDSKLSLYVLAGQFYFGLYRIISSYFKVVNKNVTLTVILIFIAVLNIVLNIIFIPQYGYIAAAVTTLICYILLFLLTYIFYFNSSKTNIISAVSFVNLILPLFIIWALKTPNIYSSKATVMLEILYKSLIATVLYVLVNLRRFKKIYHGFNH